MTDKLLSLEERMNERFGTDLRGWQVWKAAMGHWVAEVNENGCTKSENGSSICEALESVLALGPLRPDPPPRPALCHLDEFKAKKDGSRWLLLRKGMFCCRLSTKRECLTFAETLCERSREDFAKWERKVAEWRSLYGEEVTAP